jgi:hypothetical protein
MASLAAQPHHRRRHQTKAPLAFTGREVVLQGTWRGTPVAVKQLRFELADDPIATKDFKSEISLLSLLRHPNIILYMGAFEGTPKSLKETLGDKDLPIIVFEWLEGGNLFNKIHGASLTVGSGAAVSALLSSLCACDVCDRTRPSAAQVPLRSTPPYPAAKQQGRSEVTAGRAAGARRPKAAAVRQADPVGRGPGLWHELPPHAQPQNHAQGPEAAQPAHRRGGQPEDRRLRAEPLQERERVHDGAHGLVPLDGAGGGACPLPTSSPNAHRLFRGSTLRRVATQCRHTVAVCRLCVRAVDSARATHTVAV